MQIHDLRAYKSTIYEQGNPRFTIYGCLKRHILKRFPLNNALKPHFFRACGALLFSTMISNSTNPRFTMLHKTCNPRFRTSIFHDLQRCISTIYNFHDQLRKIHDLPLFTKNRRFTFQLSTICLLTTNPRFDQRFVRGGYLPLTQW